MSDRLPRSVLLPNVPLPREIGGGEAPAIRPEYMQQLTDALKSNHVQVAERIEELIEVGDAADIPDASGAGRFFYEQDTDLLKIDDGTWHSVGNTVHNHDDRYYTETELDGGQLDNRYYTESEVNGLLHAESHTIASHSDTTATGAELDELTDGSTTALHDHSAVSHTIASHSDTTATGSELETLTNGSNADALHVHAAGAYLPLSAGVGYPLTGDLHLTDKDIKLTNDYALQGRTTPGGVYYDLVQMDSDNIAHYGSVDTNAWIEGNSLIRLGRYEAVIRMEDSTGTWVDVIGMEASQLWRIGHTDRDFDIRGKNITITASSNFEINATNKSKFSTTSGAGSPNVVRTGLSSGTWCVYQNTAASPDEFFICAYDGTNLRTHQII